MADTPVVKDPAQPRPAPKRYGDFVGTDVASVKVGLAAQLEAGAARRIKR